MNNSSTGTEKYNLLRDQYPSFVYEGYTTKEKDGFLLVQYKFHISGKFFFKPELKFSLDQLPCYNKLSKQELDLFLFNIGMAELISYWKATCSPRVIINAGRIEEWQLDWWKKLYYKGLGEFFYINGIQPAFDDFMEIKSADGLSFKMAEKELENNILLPVGGGKDSIVSLEILKEYNAKVTPFVINYTPVHENVMASAGYNNKQVIKVHRTIDPALLDLNKKGFLNGHTPFSAIVAFIAAFTAYASGIKYIVLSNESSANEPTIPGTGVNHQYSKSVEFEGDFRNYVRKYMHKELEYFSFLRPLNELQIGKLFSRFKKYHESFRSCNVGSKKGVWCGKCPKCLFTYIILGPFISEKELYEIFGHNLLEDPDLLGIFQQLTGLDPEKPFECVGTISEVNAALNHMLQQKKKNLPCLLQYYAETDKADIVNEDFSNLLHSHDPDNFLPDSFDKHIMKWL